MEGRLLVSRPDLQDPNFNGTITLILEHNDAGALGVILNRPSELAVVDPFPGWLDLASEPEVIFAGGPVERDALLALGISSTVTGELPLGLQSVDLDAQPALVRAAGIDRVRLFAGYAGWGSGQLEGELAMGGWWQADAVIDDVFQADPAGLWSRVLRRSGGELEWYAHFPRDVSSN
jgi:putative transcriptional regulator